MAEFTGLPGFLRLESCVASACPGTDPSLETGLLRHRPASVLPLSWVLNADGTTLLFAELRGLEPLDQSIRSMKKDKITGYRLLGAIMAAVDEALDHLLWVEQDLLRPDMIFTPADRTKTGAGVQLLCLPFPLSLSGLNQSQEPLMDLLARFFQWDALTADRFNRLLTDRAYADLLEEAQALGGLTGQAEKTAFQGQKKHLKPSDGRGGLSSLIHSLGRALLSPGGRDAVHERTRELDLASGSYKIAQLSEGLPGTPEEECGQRAYILTQEFFIGRDRGEADLCIDSSGVSRLHARILLKSGSFFIEDLGSSNGTRVDGVRLNRHREYLLPDKCRIAFAEHFFYFRCE